MKNLFSLFFLLLSISSNAQVFEVDSSFATGGMFQFTHVGYKYTYLNNIRMMPDEKLRCFMFDSDGMHFRQHNKDGTVDTLFGDKGILWMFPKEYAGSTDLVYKNDNSSLIGARRIVAPFSDAAIMKYTKDGILDKKFGVGGIVKYSVSDGFVTSISNLIKINENKFLFGGYVIDTIGRKLPFITSIDGNGKLDTSFNHTGVYLLQKLENFEVTSLILLETGKIIVGLRSYDNKTKILTSRIQTLFQDGKIDYTVSSTKGYVEKTIFSPLGAYTYGFNYENDNNGRTYFTEYLTKDYDKPTHVTTTRYKKNGILDISFGKNGTLALDTTKDYSTPYFFDSGEILYSYEEKIGTTKYYRVRLLKLDETGKKIGTFDVNNTVNIDGEFLFRLSPREIYFDSKNRMLVSGSLSLFSQSGYFINRYLTENTISVKEQVKDEDIELFPNPVENTAKVNFDIPIAGNYAIVNMKGQVVSQQNFDQTTSVVLETASFTNGLYFINFRFQNGKQTQRRFAVQH